MIPLYDADVLTYQTGFAAESYWKAKHKEEGNEIDVKEHPPPFDVVMDMLENRISNCNAIVGASAPARMFFTGEGNFRNKISSTGYKIRDGGKPYHYYNIKAYLHGAYDCTTVNGLEADDLLAIELSNNPDNAIIIGIDKDLLQVEGWHYLYEFGNVASFGPHKVEGFGKLWFEGKKLRGYGEKFFYAQCIMGDSVDSIIGIPKSGPVAAFNLLEATTLPVEAFKAVRGAYRAFYGDLGDAFLLENGRLLNMTRKLHEDGSPVLWEFPEGIELFET